MKLLLNREIYTDTSTIGSLYVNDKFECYTLEDKIREEKIPCITAIPTGEYEVIIDLSNRFKKELPRLLNVPNYSGVRIHSGNTSENTEGCILVGCTKKVDFIGNSKIAFMSLMHKLEEAYNRKEKIIIKVQNG